jgi:hypothetical protein
MDTIKSPKPSSGCFISRIVIKIVKVMPQFGDHSRSIIDYSRSQIEVFSLDYDTFIVQA